MYCPHFGFREEPFGVSPDVRFLLSTPKHAEAMASLYYVIAQRRGFAVLFGSPGLGKTSLLVNLAERIAPQARVAFFVRPEFENRSVMQSVLLAMDIEPAPDAARQSLQFREFLLDLNRQGRTCVVIVDEAQHLDPVSLEALRMLSNFETTRHKLVQFVLAGQPGLSRLLRAPECEQIMQRINVIARLEPLDETEVPRYIEHRLKAVGAENNPFSRQVMRAIAAASKGVPREINTICFNALTLAFAEGEKKIDEAFIAEVVNDRSLGDTPQKTAGGYSLKITLKPTFWPPLRDFLRAITPFADRSAVQPIPKNLEPRTSNLEQ